jgi:hypothetical protein
VLPPPVAWRRVIGFQAEPTVTVRTDRPDLVVEINRPWHRLASEAGIHHQGHPMPLSVFEADDVRMPSGRRPPTRVTLCNRCRADGSYSDRHVATGSRWLAGRAVYAERHALSQPWAGVGGVGADDRWSVHRDGGDHSSGVAEPHALALAGRADDEPALDSDDHDPALDADDHDPAGHAEPRAATDRAATIAGTAP